MASKENRRTPKFNDIKFCLVYFKCDKQLYIYNCDELKGWNEDAYEMLKDEKKVVLQADYQFVNYEVILVQAAVTKVELKDVFHFTKCLKKIGHRLSSIRCHFKPVRIPDLRQVLPPVSVFQRLQETSTEYTDDTVSPKAQDGLNESELPTEDEDHALDLLPLPATPQSRPETTSRATPLSKKCANNLSLRFSSKMQATSSQPLVTRHQTSFHPRSPQNSYACGISNAMARLSYAAESQGYDISTMDSGHLFLQSAVIKELSKLTDAVVSLDRRMGRLEEKMSRKDEGGLIQHFPDFPVFKTMEDYMNIDAHPKDMVIWMKREGGNHAKDHIKRVMDRLLAFELQVKINRTGGYGKEKFHDNLEANLKESTQYLFPSTSSKEVEKLLSTFFKNSKDRFGGRTERRFSGHERQGIREKENPKRPRLTENS